MILWWQKAKQRVAKTWWPFSSGIQIYRINLLRSIRHVNMFPVKFFFKDVIRAVGMGSGCWVSYFYITVKTGVVRNIPPEADTARTYLHVRKIPPKAYAARTWFSVPFVLRHKRNQKDAIFSDWKPFEETPLPKHCSGKNNPPYVGLSGSANCLTIFWFRTSCNRRDEVLGD